MKIKTRELKGVALRYAVAVAEGYEFGTPRTIKEGTPTVEYHFPLIRPDWKTVGNAPYRPHAMHAWANVPAFDSPTSEKGSEIMDREKISTIWLDEADCPNREKAWSAYVGGDALMDIKQEIYGSTRTEAAMRAWAWKKLGEEIEVPDVLVQA